MGYKKLLYILLSTSLIANVEEYISQINGELSNDKFLEAIGLFDKALLKYDASAKLYYVGAQIKIKLDDLDQANKYFVKAIELDPNNQIFRNSLDSLTELKRELTAAKKSYDNGLIDDAIIEYKKLTIKYSKNARVFYELGHLHRGIDELDEAVQYFQKAKSLNPIENKYAKAIISISQRIAKKGDEEYRLQEFDDAIENYKNAIAYYPEYIAAFFKLARTYYKLKDFENARIILEQGLSVDPKQEQSEKMLGDIYRRSYDIEKAIGHYNQAILINGNYYQAFYSLGSLYLLEGRLNEAREALNKAILIEPTYSNAYGTLGTIEQELGNVEVAIKNYSRAVEFDTKAYDIYYRLSGVYNIKKQYKNAKISAKKSLSIKQNYAPAFYELGLAEMNLCNVIAAKDALEKAKKDRNFRKEANTYLKNIDYYTKDCN